jgi:hypothetical protein
MELSQEDSLRLHVLLRQDLKAVRIDEGRMDLYALTSEGEAKVSLNPTCREEKYVRLVKEMLSTQVLGSPGGYPIYLRRWTRMGQARADNLDRLLLLGEPEAVVAVVHASGLTDDLARHAWWAMPTADNARRMLEKPQIAAGSMGPELAAFLIEFLPFEENSRDMLDSVRLVLQPGLIDDATRQKIWHKGRQKNAYYVGFLHATPDDLPEQLPEQERCRQLTSDLTPMAEAGNECARQLKRALSPAGQTFLKVAREVMRKPRDQDVVVALFDAIGDFFADLQPYAPDADSLEEIITAVRDAKSAAQTGAVKEILRKHPELHAQMEAAIVLSRVDERLLRPVFSRTDAIGSVMRKKLEPLTTPILEQFDQLNLTGARH